MSEQTKNLLGGNYNPDVLECLANLSNDEVFTPPKVVNQMLDMLPPETWSNPNLKFLDPACKTGVFLREIAKRLIVGLEEQIPDLQRRLDHIFHNQLYGIAITELTALASRRSLYCSKYANGKYSVSKFDNPDGNIRFVPINHTWENGKCKYCGASASQYQRADDLETHAYEFIHTNNPEEIFGMKFDVIIGNPPYQLKSGGAQAQATPIYNRFVEQSKNLNPSKLCMITPSRWFTSGMGLDKFRSDMLDDRHFVCMHDFLDASNCFPGVEIKGGVNYFLWEKSYKGECQVTTHDENGKTSTMSRNLRYGNSDVFIRYNEAISVLDKVRLFKENTFNTIVSSISPFGLPTSFGDFEEKKPNDEAIKIYAYRRSGYLKTNSVVKTNIKLMKSWKLYVPEAIGSGDSKTDWVKPFIGEPNTVSTATYMCIGCSNDKNEIENILSYTQTKFFHFLLTLKKNTQHTPAKCYSFIPLQDFSKPWIDEELYKKYNLSEEEIKFIEENIAPMEDK